MLGDVYVSRFTTVNAAAKGLSQLQQALEQGRSGLRPNQFDALELDIFVGAVDGVDRTPLKPGLQLFDCRNNRLAQMCLQQDAFDNYVFQLKRRYGDSRIAVIVGTSTSGIYKLEMDYRHLDPLTGDLPNDGRGKYTHNLSSLASFVKAYFDLRGPAQVVSTACSSSAKVFASAARLLSMDFADAVIVGGVDSLCLNTLYGFHSLQLLSSRACKPLDRDRNGLTIGEGAGFAVVEKVPSDSADFVAQLLGYGESSDGFHMSSPSPNGEGAAAAMLAALDMSELAPGDIDYINMHGTATPINDKAESCAISQVFGANVACSSTKGWMGHTLGAAGIIEAVICFLALKNQHLPATLNCDNLDPEFSINALLQNRSQTTRYVLSNSFGFGGSNCSLIFGAAA